MMKVTPGKKTIISFLALLLIFTAFGSPAFSAEKSIFADIVAEDAYFYIENFPLKENSSTPFLEKLLSSPEMQEVLKPLEKYIMGMDSLAAMMAGVSPASTIKNTSGKMGFAVIKTKAGRPGILCWIDLEGEIDNFQKSLPGLETFLAGRINKTVEVVKTKDFAIKTIPVGLTKLAWLTTGSNLLFGEFTYLKSIIDNEFTVAAPLAESEEYKKSLEIMQLDRGGLLVVADTSRMFQPPPQAPEAGRKFFEAFREIRARKISAGFIPYKKGYKDVTITWMAEGADALKRIYPPKNVTLKHTVFVPQDTEHFMTGHLLLDNSYSILWKVFENFGKLPLPQMKSITKTLNRIKKIEEELQFDFSEILATVGSECSLAVSPSGSFAVLDIRSRPAFDAYMDQLNTWLDDKAFKKLTYRDFTINYLPKTGHPLPFAFCYTMIDNNTMAAAFYPHILKKFINNMHNKNFASIEKNKDYLKLKDETRRGNIFSYSRIAPMTENVYSKAVPLLQMMSAIPLNPVDAGRLPPFESFSEDLFGMVKSSWLIDNGMVQESYSPFGMGGDIISAFDLYASILENPAISMLITAAAAERVFPAPKAEFAEEEEDAGEEE
ncbi:MAG: hypothetical protein ACYTFY_07650 [Planctomycetota bacterium]|jgi:hypothetical protein